MSSRLVVVVQFELLDGRSLSPLFAIGRFNRAEIFALAADDEDAPSFGAELIC